MYEVESEEAAQVDGNEELDNQTGSHPEDMEEETDNRTGSQPGRSGTLRYG